MPLELKLGRRVPIPCRHCEQALIPFVVKEGLTSLACPRCESMTEVKVARRGKAYEIRTERGKASSRLGRQT